MQLQLVHLFSSHPAKGSRYAKGRWS